MTPQTGPPTDLELIPGAPAAIRSVEGATVQPPPLAYEPNILDLVAAELVEAGMVGESRNARLLYLIVTSRLLDRPCSAVVKGPSAGGKSFLVEQVLALFPTAAYHALSAMSDRALAYDQEPLVHRILVLYEAAGLSGDIATYLVRSLLSEGRIRYLTVERTKAGNRSKLIEREGPTGLITTTTAASLHPENETRLISLTVADSPDQTRAVMVAAATGRSAPRDRAAWYELQEWLAACEAEVVVPFAPCLAELVPPVAVRMRRDFPTFLALVRTHALLHRINRERDSAGRVIATIGDYEAVRELAADLMSDAVDRTVSATTRETIVAVAGLAEAGETTVTAIARSLGLDKSAASRRVRVGVERGYLRNLEDRLGRPARLVLGDPLPADAEILPAPAVLERLRGCTGTAGDTLTSDHGNGR
jgi:DNA-binding MarR family transcriptional regulator